MIVECPKCGSTFENDTKRGWVNKFCSRRCANSRDYTPEQKLKISQTQKSVALREKSLGIKRKVKRSDRKSINCLLCGVSFHEQYKGRKFCSFACSSEAQRGAKKIFPNKSYARDNTARSYIIYKTTNLITGEFYVGVHLVTDNDDSYLGSGIRIRRSIRKYGKGNFIRTTLQDNLTEQEAFFLEQEVVASLIGDSLCLNLAKGGYGGPNFKGKKHSEETERKLREATLKSLEGKERKIKTILCLYCNKQFKQTHSVQKFCSRSCSHSFIRNKSQGSSNGGLSGS